MRKLRLKQGILPPDWCPRELPPRRTVPEPAGSLRVLPLRSYRYDAALSCVQPGQQVTGGQPLSTPLGLLSRPRLAPVAGRITAVENRRLGNGVLVPCAVLQPATLQEQPLAWDTAVSAAGLESQQGVPLDFEMACLPERPVLLLNAAETELGHWSLMAHLEDLAAGASVDEAFRYILERVRPGKVFLAHRGAQRKPAEMLAERLAAASPVTRIQLDNSHPGAHPRLLAERAAALAGGSRRLRPDRLLAAQGVLVLDLDRLCLLQRRLTVGPADHFLLSVFDPEGNGEVCSLPSGMPCDTLFDGQAPRLAFAGGAMLGHLLKDADSPLLPPLRALCFSHADPVRHREDACITCGRCLEACPRQLAPPRLVHLIEEGRLREAVRMGLEECLLCGVCSYVCPSRIHLGHSLGKGLWQLQEARHE